MKLQLQKLKLLNFNLSKLLKLVGVFLIVFSFGIKQNFAQSPCDDITEIEFGETYTATLEANSGYWTEYNGGSGLTYSGSEKVFKFTPTLGGIYDFYLYQGDKKVDFFLMSDCDPNSTNLTGSTDGYWDGLSSSQPHSKKLDRNQVYYLIADMWATSGETTISVSISINKTPCEDITELILGETYTAELEPDSGYWGNYNGVSFNYHGSEKVFKLSTSVAGTYKFYVDEGTEDADFFLMSDCDPSSTNIDGGYWDGDAAMYMELEANTDYYLIADLWSTYGPTTVTVRVEVDPCDNITEMELGENYTATLYPDAGYWTNYTDVGISYHGSEKVFKFTPNLSGDYTFYVKQGARDADFFLMSACDPSSTNFLGVNGYWSGHEGNQLFTVELEAGTDYYLIADLWYSDGTTVTVRVMAEPCNSVIDLVLDEVYTGNLYPNIGYWESYSENTNSYTGSERVYKFTPSTTGQYDFFLNQGENDADFMLFSSCDHSSENLTNSANGFWEGDGSVNYYSINLTQYVNYYLFVDLLAGEDATQTTISVRQNPCEAPVEVTLNQVYNAVLKPNMGYWNSYGSGSNIYTGSEAVFKFTPESTASYEFYLDQGVRDADFFLLSDCDPNATSLVEVDFWEGDDFSQAYFANLTAGQDYYLIADLMDTDAETEISVKVSVNSCDDITEMELGVLYSAWLYPNSGNITSYPGVSREYSGGEKVYKFTPTTTREYDIFVEEHRDVDFFLMSACDGDSENLTPTGFWDGKIDEGFHTMELEAGVDYYLIADLRTGEDYSFLRVKISLEPCEDITVMEFGETYYATLYDAGGYWDNYTNTPTGWEFLGTEKVFEYTANFTGIHRFYLDNAGSAMFVLMSECNPESNNFINNTYALWFGYPDDVILIELEVGETYYLIADLDDLSESEISVRVDIDLSPCETAIEIELNQTYTAYLVPDDGVWVNYTDVEYNYTGSEQVFVFIPEESANYDFYVDQGSENADFFLMTACSPLADNFIGTYWNGGTTSKNFSVDLVAGTEYYLIADLFESVTNPTTVTVKVSTSPCNFITEMEFGTTYTATLVPNSGYWTNYSDVSADYEGSEKVFKFKTSNAGMYNLFVDQGSENADFFLMSDCNPESENLSGETGYFEGDIGSQNFFLDLEENTTYYLIADLHKLAYNSTTVQVRISTDPCNDITEMELNTNYSATLYPNSGYWTNYTDVSEDYEGSEKVFKFIPSFSGTYLYYVDEGFYDADFILMSDCNPESENLTDVTFNVWGGDYGNNYFEIELEEGVAYYLIADLNSTIATTVTVRVSANPCDDITEMDLGVTYYANLYPEGGYWEDYSDNSEYYSGTEKVFKFTPTTSGVFEFFVDEGEADADFMLMSDCDPLSTNLTTSSLGYWEGNEGNRLFTVELVAETDYFLIADLYDYNETVISVKVNSNPCDDIIEIVCGEIYTATLIPNHGYWTNYNEVEINYTGSEKVFKFIPNSSETYEFNLYQGDNNADFFLMSDCDPNSENLLEDPYYWNAESTTSKYSIDLTSGQTYYLIADLRDGQGETTIELSIDCQNAISDNFANQGEINIYPNPAREQITIESTYSSFMKDVQIVDLLGKISIKTNVDTIGDYTLNIQDLMPGMYIIMISLEDGQVINRRLQVSR